MGERRSVVAALLAGAAGTGIAFGHASDQPGCRRRFPAPRRLLGRPREHPRAWRLLGALVVPDTARADSGGPGRSWLCARPPSALAERLRDGRNRRAKRAAARLRLLRLDATQPRSSKSSRLPPILTGARNR